MSKSYVCIVSMVTAVVLFCCASCDSQKATPPAIAFKTGSAYVSNDTALTSGTIFTLGIRANKTGNDGILTSCQISKSINGGEDSVIQGMNFFYQTFAADYSYLAGDSGTAEKYTFTVRKNDGRSNSVSVTIAVQ